MADVDQPAVDPHLDVSEQPELHCHPTTTRDAVGPRPRSAPQIRLYPADSRLAQVSRSGPRSSQEESGFVRVGQARAAARDWVARHVSEVAGFGGAYVSGSTVGLPDSAELSPTSDLDVVVVTAGPGSPPKLGKVLYRGALLEISYQDWTELGTAEHLLGSYRLAGSFRVDTIIADPTGRLARLQAVVGRGFAERVWIRRRCADARRTIEHRLAGFDPAQPLHQQVTRWLFGTGGTAHLPLVAALRNPTVRLRYLAAREVLVGYGHGDRYPDLLALLGCAQWSAERAGQHLAELGRTFDATAAVATTPFFFSSDLTAPARPIAIDGSRELIAQGNHREAVFWMVATFARCHTVLAVDAPDLHREHLPAFRAMLADLGLSAPGDLGRRAEQVRAALPELWQLTEQIVVANPDALH